ncbi:hypothetical protein HO133_010198 [Letharia lupina]|uniref:BTB domain-containing protein n=1 Tax=Letharia lupina TaxID=560253 RepID=A0A8H6FEK6_9LECA|nr:uncharacterized protein HO133_010198 [Letharia lupina]KAF6225003.1 hypothetical protein HO133_010198 [Letharia lupina]
MADPEVRISGGVADESGDVDMQGGDSADVMEVGETGDDAPGDEAAEDEAAIEAETPAARVTFVDYLKSPIVTLHIGSGDAATQLTAHQALLVKSPFFADAIAPDSASPKHSIDLKDDDLEATSCFLEYLYTGEYFPHKLPSGSLQSDPSTPGVDQTGDQLLKHAKVYTLAEKLSMPALKTLSHSKIHLVTSTAVAELTYARYVYSHTGREDATIRKPVASFWGQRSHVLRHETEGTFRKMCLEYPEFAFDVLSFVLDAEEKREERRRKADDGEGGKGSARKRARGER